MATGGINVKLSDSPICGICEENENVKKRGFKYCRNCSDWICSACVDAHGRFRTTRNHVLEDVASSSKINSELCSSHITSLLSFFCTMCNVCVCAECRIDDGIHKDHKCIRMEEHVEMMRSELTKNLSHFEKSHQDLQTQKKLLHKEFQSASDKLNNLEKVITDLRKELQAKKNNVEKQIQDQMKEVEERIKKAKQYIGNTKATIKMTDLTQLTSATVPMKPEVPQFLTGVYEAGIKIMAGDGLTHENITDVLKFCREKGKKLTGLYEVGLWLLLDEELTGEQKSKLVDDVLAGDQLARLMTVGVRVKHGRDWPRVYGSRNQTGTVTSGLDADKFVTVKWDDNGSVNRWCMGYNNQYNLTLLF